VSSKRDRPRKSAGLCWAQIFDYCWPFDLCSPLCSHNCVDPRAPCSVKISERLFHICKKLYASVDECVTQLDIARSRLRDLLAWLRMVISDIKAFGTSADSAEREIAAKRKVSGGVIKSVSLFLNNRRRKGSEGLTNGTEFLLDVQMSSLLNNKKLVERVNSLSGVLFNQPMHNIQTSSIFTTRADYHDIDFNSLRCHTRSGGKFSIADNSDKTSSWTVFTFTRCAHKIQFGAVKEQEKEKTYWSGIHLGSGETTRVMKTAYYSDGDTSGEREKLILLVWSNNADEELWMLDYDDLNWSVTQNDESVFKNVEFANLEDDDGDDENNDESGFGEVVVVKRRVIRQINPDNSNASDIFVDGNRGIGVVVTAEETTVVHVFDMEEDEDEDEDDDDDDDDEDEDDDDDGDEDVDVDEDN